MNNCSVELDIQALNENIKIVKGLVPAGTEIILVSKANAYGHGMQIIAPEAWSAGIKWFAVAHFEEAMELRELLPEANIIILGAMSPQSAAHVAAADIVTVLIDEAHARSLDEAAADSGHVLRCHAKIDTGMGRLGFVWKDAAEQIAALSALKHLHIEGLCSHFSSVSEDDMSFAQIQAERFQHVIDSCRKLGVEPGFTHIANSSAVINFRSCVASGVRPGILVYGYTPSGRIFSGPLAGIKPVLSWKTSVIQVKDVPAGFPVGYDRTYTTKRATRIATLDVGYSDGYPRHASNRGMVLINGIRHRIAGRVTMNFITVDCGPDSDVKVGDEVVLIGRQREEKIWADELASVCETVHYEILTGIQTVNRRLKE